MQKIQCKEHVGIYLAISGLTGDAVCDLSSLLQDCTVHSPDNCESPCINSAVISLASLSHIAIASCVDVRVQWGPMEDENGLSSRLVRFDVTDISAQLSTSFPSSPTSFAGDVLIRQQCRLQVNKNPVDVVAFATILSLFRESETSNCWCLKIEQQNEES